MRETFVSSLTGAVAPLTVATILYLMTLKVTIVITKQAELSILQPALLAQSRLIGERIARLRRARSILQADAALRAGISRPTATRIEAGDPGRTLGQMLRYLEAIAPSTSLLTLLQASDPALAALEQREATRRVRRMSAAELKKLDF